MNYEEEIEEGGIIGEEEELDVPPGGTEEGFGLEDPDDKYH